MSILDAERRVPVKDAKPSGFRALTERRVDPGVANPERVSGASKLSPPPPKVKGRK